MLSALAAAAAAIRLFFLPSRAEYRLFIALFATWVVPNILPFALPVTSRWYFAIYVFLSPISWLLYIFVSRDIYQKIFGRYKGIAFAGRTCLHISVVCLFVSIAVGLFFSDPSVRGSTFANFTSIDRGVLFGLSLFLLLVVATMIRYPMPITRNFIVHCIFFSAALLLQSVFFVVDQVSGYRLSMLWDTLIAALTALVGHRLGAGSYKGWRYRDDSHSPKYPAGCSRPTPGRARCAKFDFVESCPEIGTNFC